METPDRILSEDSSTGLRRPEIEAAFIPVSRDELRVLRVGEVVWVKFDHDIFSLKQKGFQRVTIIEASGLLTPEPHWYYEGTNCYGRIGCGAHDILYPFFFVLDETNLPEL